jgi:hypothetical protein
MLKFLGIKEILETFHGNDRLDDIRSDLAKLYI